jgi:excinuclease ABC subunit B
VSLVAILDADKEGFLRAERSLIQTIGRAARNLNGKAILYADRMTDSMKKAIGETERRGRASRSPQRVHGITPRSIVKQVRDLIDGVYSEKPARSWPSRSCSARDQDMSEKGRGRRIKRWKKLMLEHARNLNSRRRRAVRDQLPAQGAGLRRRGTTIRRAAQAPSALSGSEPGRITRATIGFSGILDRKVNTKN